MVGRFALAATANASATRNATFCPLAPMPAMIETMPITTTVIRATRTSPLAETCPFLMTLPYTSCAKDAAAVMVRPATTARIVANATAAMIPSRIGPPSSSASRGAAEFTPPGAARIRSLPSSAPAPYPSTRVKR